MSIDVVTEAFALGRRRRIALVQEDLGDEILLWELLWLPLFLRLRHDMVDGDEFRDEGLIPRLRRPRNLGEASPSAEEIRGDEGGTPLEYPEDASILFEEAWWLRRRTARAPDGGREFGSSDVTLANLEHVILCSAMLSDGTARPQSSQVIIIVMRPTLCD